MTKAIIFDMDGVIIDSEGMQQTAYYEAFRKQGVKIAPDDYTENMGRNDAFQRIAEKYGRQIDFDRLYWEKNKKYHQLIKGGIKPVDGLLCLLKLATKNSFKLGLASASSMMNIRLVLTTLKITKFFDVVVGIDLVRNGKPAPDLFILAADKLRISPQQCVVVEDSPNGVVAAKKAKMRCIGYTGTQKRKQNLPQADFVVDDLGKISLKMLFGQT